MKVDYDNILERQRKYKDLSLSEAAKIIGISKPHLFDIEKGNSVNPTAKVLNGFRKLYGLSAECLLELFNFDTFKEHQLTPDCWCNPEHTGDGVYVHKDLH